jgi:hypothetical protein
VGLWDFLAYRFVAGLGVGGQFAIGCSLVSLPFQFIPLVVTLVQKRRERSRIARFHRELLLRSPE